METPQVASKFSKSVGVICKSSFCFTVIGQFCVLYSIHLSIPISHLRCLVLLQKRIVRIINKRGFDAHSGQLFKNLNMILKLGDISILCISGTLCFLSKITQSRPVFPDPFYVLFNQVHGL